MVDSQLGAPFSVDTSMALIMLVGSLSRNLVLLRFVVDDKLSRLHTWLVPGHEVKWKGGFGGWRMFDRDVYMHNIYRLGKPTYQTPPTTTTTATDTNIVCCS